jgi:RNA polymerase sigma factor (sigma-70 family)
MDHELLSDSDLLTRWCSGDNEAGDALTRRHFSAVRGFVRRKLDNPAAVDDIVNDTFMSLLEGKHRIREGLKIRGFLNCIASRRLFRWLREHRRFDSFEPDEMSISRAASTLGLLHSDAKLLYVALRELPAEEQLALELYNWEELSAPEVAEVTGATLAQVKHRLRRGKEKLEALLARYRREHRENDVATAELAAWFAALRERAEGLKDDEDLPS